MMGNLSDAIPAPASDERLLLRGDYLEQVAQDLTQRTVIFPSPLPSRFMSTRPVIPGTLPEFVYCQTE